MPLEAEGSFTPPTTDELRFGEPMPVRLVRLTKDEVERLSADTLGELAAAAFEGYGGLVSDARWRRPRARPPRWRRRRLRR